MENSDNKRVKYDDEYAKFYEKVSEIVEEHSVDIDSNEGMLEVRELLNPTQSRKKTHKEVVLEALRPPSSNCKLCEISPIFMKKIDCPYYWLLSHVPNTGYEGQPKFIVREVRDCLLVRHENATDEKEKHISYFLWLEWIKGHPKKKDLELESMWPRTSSELKKIVNETHTTIDFLIDCVATKFNLGKNPVKDKYTQDLRAFCSAYSRHPPTCKGDETFLMPGQEEFESLSCPPNIQEAHSSLVGKVIDKDKRQIFKNCVENDFLILSALNSIMARSPEGNYLLKVSSTSNPDFKHLVPPNWQIVPVKSLQLDAEGYRVYRYYKSKAAPTLKIKTYKEILLAMPEFTLKFNAIGFEPNLPYNPLIFNFFKGFAHDSLNPLNQLHWNKSHPIQTSLLSNEHPHLVEMFFKILDHLKQRLCYGPSQTDIRKLRHIFFGLIYNTIKHPEIRIPRAVLVEGVQGTGKSLIYHILSLVYGANYCFQFISNDNTDNKFYYHLVEGKLLVCMDEYGQGNGLSEKWIGMLTAGKVHCERKSINPYEISLLFWILVFSDKVGKLIGKTVEERRIDFFSMKPISLDQKKAEEEKETMADIGKFLDPKTRKEMEEVNAVGKLLFDYFSGRGEFNILTDPELNGYQGIPDIKNYKPGYVNDYYGKQLYLERSENPSSRCFLNFIKSRISYNSNNNNNSTLWNTKMPDCPALDPISKKRLVRVDVVFSYFKESGSYLSDKSKRAFKLSTFITDITTFLGLQLLTVKSVQYIAVPDDFNAFLKQKGLQR